MISIATRAVVSLTVIAIGVGIFVALVASKRTTPQVGANNARPSVVVFEARQVPVSRQWTGYGTADALDYADVPARVTATVESIPSEVQAGRPVEQGQVLVRLDPTDFRRQLEIAQTTVAELQAQLRQLDVEQQRLREQVDIEQRELQIARNELQRVEQLYAQDAARSRDVDDARRTVLAAEARHVQTQQALESIAPRRAGLEARLAGQEAAVRRAQVDLDRTTIRSPIAGVLQDVMVRAGENVPAGQPVARVVNLERIEVPLRLPTLARPSISVGDAVQVATTGASEGRWDARVTRIAPESDPQTRTMTAFVEVSQPNAAERYTSPTNEPVLTPGAFVTGRVESSRPQPRWIVPRRSIRNGRIMTVVSDQLRSVPVTADYGIEGTFDVFPLPDRQWMVIEAPLQPGDAVLVNVPTDLSDGQWVTAVPATGVAESSAAGASAAGAGGAEQEARP